MCAERGCGHWSSLRRQDTEKGARYSCLGSILFSGYGQISLGHPGWERVKEAKRVQQRLPRAEAQSQLGCKAARTPHRGSRGLTPLSWGQPCPPQHGQEVTEGSNEGVMTDEGTGAAGREVLAQPQCRQPPHLHLVRCQLAQSAQHPQHIPGWNWGCRRQTGLWDGADREPGAGPWSRAGQCWQCHRNSPGTWHTHDCAQHPHSGSSTLHPQPASASAPRPHQPLTSPAPMAITPCPSPSITD